MDSRFRLLAASCALVLVAGIFSAFTFDGDDQDVATDADRADDAVETDGSDVESIEADDPADDPVDDDGDTPEDGDTNDDEAQDSSTAPGDDAPSQTTTTAPAQTTTTTQPPTTTPVGVTPTAPGTYTYDISGTVDGDRVSGTSRLTVPDPDGNGRQTQTQSGPEGRSATTYRFTPEGTYLESITMSAQGQNMTLSASQPFLVIPAGASPGAQALGRLTGGGLTADITFTMVEVGADRSTAKIEAVISGSVFGCSVRGDMDSTIAARTSDQLPVDTVSRTDVTISNCLFAGKASSDTQTVLRG